MSRQQELHYKDRKPEETVERIQSLLKELEIETEETSVPDSSAGTCSLRVNVKGTGFGANGKGVSPSYARASAYAEFMERLQNDIMTVFARYPKQKEGFYRFPDEKFCSAAEIAGMENAFLDYFWKCTGMEQASAEEKAGYLRKYYKVDDFLNGEKDRYSVLPFYSARKKKVEYLPYYLYLVKYSSNGMSAGNSPWEALVQGFSEIIERHVQEKIYLEKPSLPDVPDEYIQKYPYVWEKVQKLRSLPGLRVAMKDCSFGGKYPVAALILVDENTCCYGVKLGCHPDYGVAMERTITESSQGCDFYNYARRSVLDFSNQNVDSNWNIYNSYKFGQAPFPYEIFGTKSSFPFVPVKDVSAMSNQEIFREMLNGFLEEGYDVLIRDVSYTGFPSFHIIIPGFSEINRDSSELYAKAVNTKIYLQSYLNYPETIDVRIARLLRGTLDFFSESQIENSMKHHYSVYPDTVFPGEELQLGWLYMTVMCCVMLREYKEAAQRMKSLLTEAVRRELPEASFYAGIYHYAVARGQGMAFETVMEYLEQFLDAELIKRLRDLFEDETKVFVRQYPRFDFQGRDGKIDDRVCEYNIWLQTKAKMVEYMKNHPVDQKGLEQIIEYEG